VGGEAGILVSYYATGESKPQVEVLVVEFGNLWAGDGALAW
jgi:hypothetical protein